MKFFELALCLEPAIPGGLSRAPYFREIVSMVTLITEDDGGTRKDPAGLPSDSTLESMHSCDKTITKRLAQAICSKLNTSHFIDCLNGLDLEVQELITQSIKQHSLYLNQVATQQAAIDEQKRQIISLGESVQLDDETYKKSLALNTKIVQLEEQIRPFDQNEQLKVEHKALRRDLKESIPEKLEHFGNKINAEIQSINKSIYEEEHRKSPIFSCKLATRGVSYNFDHNGDGGSGAKANHLILFDLAVLHSTPLPFLVHDSAIIKTIVYDPVAELLEVYSETSHLTSRANEPKQVFFSFDATQSYGEKA